MAAKWGGTIKTYLAGIGGMTIAYGTIMQVAASQKRSKNKMVPDGVVLHLDMGVPIVETPPSPLVREIALILYLYINVQQTSLIKCCVRSIRHATYSMLLESYFCAPRDACSKEQRTLAWLHAALAVVSSEEEHIEHQLSPAYASEERERASVPHLHS